MNIDDSHILFACACAIVGALLAVVLLSSLIVAALDWIDRHLR